MGNEEIRVETLVHLRATWAQVEGRISGDGMAPVGVTLLTRPSPLKLVGKDLGSLKAAKDLDSVVVFAHLSASGIFRSLRNPPQWWKKDLVVAWVFPDTLLLR